MKVFEPTFVKDSGMLTLQECVASLKYIELRKINAQHLQRNEK